MQGTHDHKGTWGGGPKATVASTPYAGETHPKRAGRISNFQADHTDADLLLQTEAASLEFSGACGRAPGRGGTSRGMWQSTGPWWKVSGHACGNVPGRGGIFPGMWESSGLWRNIPGHKFRAVVEFSSACGRVPGCCGIFRAMWQGGPDPGRHWQNSPVSYTGE